MDFITKQSKLSKSEWDGIEVPLAEHEKRILALIQDGANDVNITRNYTQTLINYTKIPSSAQIDSYIYKTYFAEYICRLYENLDDDYVEYICPPLEKNKKNTGKKADIHLKKADIIRLENTNKHIEEHKKDIFEFIVLELLGKMLAKKKALRTKKSESSGTGSGTGTGTGTGTEWMFYYYTIYNLMKYNVEDVNDEFRFQVMHILKEFLKVKDTPFLIKAMIENGQTLIEKNDYLLKYADETLYDHQKKLFSVCRQPTPKLVLYIAPTGTGKTMSPLGLTANYRVIFVCAARHVGLALAKAAISMQKKIAFAFGCNDAEDIRLHYYAAKEYTKNAKSGGIGRVDNTQGEKVEIMISDVQSYLPAMLYMLAFNPKEKIIVYWDEPTITMDYENHELHDLIQKNWNENLIPNLVLSSATLPQQSEITETIMDFCSRFDGVDVHEIISYDCKKTIPMINREGYTEMPHYLFSDYSKIKEVSEHCTNNKTLLRYIDLGEAIKFIMYIDNYEKTHSDPDNVNMIRDERYSIKSNFANIDDVSMASIKLFYLELLGNLNNQLTTTTEGQEKRELWPILYETMQKQRMKAHDSNVNIVTTDAHTLTDGPTIFLANDVNKIAQFYIQSANIPEIVIKNIMEKITFNRKLNEQIRVLEKDLEDATGISSSGASKDDKKEKSKKDKMNSKNEDSSSSEIKKLKQKISKLSTSVQTVIMDPMYVPNTRDHLYKYATKFNPGQMTNAFTSDISEETVEQIMLIPDILDYWKLLLLIGIGVFSEHKSIRYTEVMKKLAQDHKLFMIIASSDFIYGTNYQFCHGYIGKDLETMSQEKCVQAMGRVGRNKIQQNYSIRFRNNELIYKLFQHDDNKPEVLNMNRLFNTANLE